MILYRMKNENIEQQHANWLRKGEQSFVERLTKAFEDLNNVNTL